MKRVLLALLAATFLLGACGDDGDSGSNGASSASVEKVKASLERDDDGFALESDDAECVAKKVAGLLGDERVDEIDFDGGDVTFEEDEAGPVADAFDDCLELDTFFAESFTAELDISDESRKCLADKIDSDDVKALLVVGFSGVEDGFEDAYAPIDAVFESCLTPEEYEQVS